jgi:hypothetical protein
MIDTNENSQLAKVDTDLSKVTFPTVNLNNFEISDLDDAEVMPIELTSIYWTPEEKGESIRAVFLNIEYVEMAPMSDKDKENLNENGNVWIPCAYFMTSNDDGEAVKVCNSSKRLISTLQGSFIKPMTPLLITYSGKVRNKTNAFSSDSWSVKPLNVKTIPIAEKVREDVGQKANNEEIGIDTKDTAPQSSFQQAMPSHQESTTPAAGVVSSASAKPRPRFN